MKATSKVFGFMHSMHAMVSVACVGLVCMGTACTSTTPVAHLGKSSAPSQWTGSMADASVSTRQEQDHLSKSKEERMLAKTADVALETESPEATCKNIAESVAGMPGGYLVRRTNKSVIVRVPSSDVERFVDGLSEYGVILERSINAVDVTDSYTDTELRLASAKRTRERYLEILAKASTVEEILAVEDELQRLNLEIEQLTAHLANIGKSVDLSTVSIYALEPVKPGPLGYVFVGIYEGIKWLFVWD